MTRAIFLRRFQTIACSRCCGTCTGEARNKRYAVGFAPSVEALTAASRQEVQEQESLYAVVA